MFTPAGTMIESKVYFLKVKSNQIWIAARLCERSHGVGWMLPNVASVLTPWLRCGDVTAVCAGSVRLGPTSCSGEEPMTQMKDLFFLIKGVSSSLHLQTTADGICTAPGNTHCVTPRAAAILCNEGLWRPQRPPSTTLTHTFVAHQSFAEKHFVWFFPSGSLCKITYTHTVWTLAVLACNQLAFIHAALACYQTPKKHDCGPFWCLYIIVHSSIPSIGGA